MQGAIDNVVFYDMALTSYDINAIYKKFNKDSVYFR